MSRQIVFIPVGKDDRRIQDIFELQTSDRTNYNWLRTYVRNTYGQWCDIVMTTTDKLDDFMKKTYCKPYDGTYLMEGESNAVREQ